MSPHVSGTRPELEEMNRSGKIIRYVSKYGTMFKKRHGMKARKGSKKYTKQTPGQKKPVHISSRSASEDNSQKSEDEATDYNPTALSAFHKFANAAGDGDEANNLVKSLTSSPMLRSPANKDHLGSDGDFTAAEEETKWGLLRKGIRKLKPPTKGKQRANTHTFAIESVLVLTRGLRAHHDKSERTIRISGKNIDLAEGSESVDQLTMSALQRAKRRGVAAINSKDGFMIDKNWTSEQTRQFLSEQLPLLMNHIEHLEAKSNHSMLYTCTRVGGRWGGIGLTGGKVPDGETIFQNTWKSKSGTAGTVLLLATRVPIDNQIIDQFEEKIAAEDKEGSDDNGDDIAFASEGKVLEEDEDLSGDELKGIPRRNFSHRHHRSITPESYDEGLKDHRSKRRKLSKRVLDSPSGFEDISAREDGASNAAAGPSSSSENIRDTTPPDPSTSVEAPLPWSPIHG
ncbi:MAG: hypothetical protein NXY57DRAFT_1083542 [Lentinula lateritia]|nr:MAG: hypothetical protein NXY57DRAFT_1083542 [Lentinula lateritia]